MNDVFCKILKHFEDFRLFILNQSFTRKLVALPVSDVNKKR
jgi:hypothetical protein